MDLLTDNDWSEFRSAIHDVTDTFFKLPVVYIRRGADGARKLTAFHEDRSTDLPQQNYNLIALLVPESKDSRESQAKQLPKGFPDLSEGYFLFNYADLKSQSPALINADGQPVFVPNKDSFFAVGKEYTIIGVNLVGPSEDDFQLVKVHYKQQLGESKLAPINIAMPLITGAAVVGQLLSVVSAGTWKGTAPIVFTYQWRRNGVDIVGATGSSYTLQPADSGTSITCRVTGTNSTGAIFVITDAVAIP